MLPNRQMWLFFAALLCFTMAAGINESIFNNYLKDTFDPSAAERGQLEFPRELPGFLVVVMAGALATLAVTHLAVTAALVFGAGLAGIVLAGPRFGPMIAMMMLASAGMHLLQPVDATIALALSDEAGRGRRMGQLGGVKSLGFLAGSSFIWLFFRGFGTHYALGFFVAAGACGCAAVFYALLHLPHLHQRRSRLVWRRKYGLYYVLEALFGARKQIFITFGYWVLVDVYGQPAAGIAQLLMVATAVGIVFKPLVGMAIDRFGERTILIVDGVVLAAVCVGYGYAAHFTATSAQALLVARACFIIDNLLFALGTGRAVYLSRIADSPQDLTSSLAMGVSINHIASMTLPALAGVVWMRFGYECVFLIAAVLALIISCVSSLVPRKRPPAPAPEERPAEA